MMPVSRNIVFSVLMMTVYLCSAQKINVLRVGDTTDASGNEGIYYVLPRTQFDIEVTVIKVEEIKGPYSEFAGKYLGLTNVIEQNKTSYELDDIMIKSTPVPDPSQYYFVELKGKCSKEAREMLVMLSESGIIQNTTGSELAEKVPEQTLSHAEESNVYPDIFKYFSDLNLFERVDTIIEKVNVDTATIEKVTFRRTMVQKTPEQKAKDAADFIIKIKDNRFNLISGFQEVNYDKETFTLMNEELEKLETEYRKLFTGLTFTKTLTYHYRYMPDPLRPIDSIPLFRYSRLRGVLNTDNPNGEVVYLKIRRTNDTRPLADNLKKKVPSKKIRHGFYYRIPEYADVSVLLSNKTRTEGKFLVSQFGVVLSLPAGKAGIHYYPATGAIQQYGIGK